MSVDNREQYLAYMQGWSAGAGAKAKDSVLLCMSEGHPLRVAYEDGYRGGHGSRNAASLGASGRFGYAPSVLRGTTPPPPASESAE